MMLDSSAQVPLFGNHRRRRLEFKLQVELQLEYPRTGALGHSQSSTKMLTSVVANPVTLRRLLCESDRTPFMHGGTDTDRRKQQHNPPPRHCRFVPVSLAVYAWHNRRIDRNR